MAMPTAPRPSRLGRVARLVVPGVRRVHRQVDAYAEEWRRSNQVALAGDGPVWAVLGDSTAQGVGASSFDQGWVGQLHRRLGGGWRVLNWSRSGACVGDVLAVQLPMLEALDPAPGLVTCAVGANDVYRTGLDDLLGGLSELIGRLPAGSVIATIPQGLKGDKAAVANDLIWEAAPAAGLRVADVWSRTGPPWQGKFASDWFHPSALGYADWASAFADAMEID